MYISNETVYNNEVKIKRYCEKKLEVIFNTRLNGINIIEDVVSCCRLLLNTYI